MRREMTGMRRVGVGSDYTGITQGELLHAGGPRGRLSSGAIWVWSIGAWDGPDLMRDVAVCSPRQWLIYSKMLGGLARHVLVAGALGHRGQILEMAQRRCWQRAYWRTGLRFSVFFLFHPCLMLLVIIQSRGIITEPIHLLPCH